MAARIIQRTMVLLTFDETIFSGLFVACRTPRAWRRDLSGQRFHCQKRCAKGICGAGEDRAVETARRQFLPRGGVVQRRQSPRPDAGEHYRRFACIVETGSGEDQGLGL